MIEAGHGSGCRGGFGTARDVFTSRIRSRAPALRGSESRGSWGARRSDYNFPRLVNTPSRNLDVSRQIEAHRRPF